MSDLERLTQHMFLGAEEIESVAISPVCESCAVEGPRYQYDKTISRDSNRSALHQLMRLHGWHPGEMDPLCPNCVPKEKQQ